MKRIIMLLLACCLLVGVAAAAGGSGTAADPYIIETPAELQSVQNNLAAYYVLGADIDLSGGFTPIGSTSTPFIGHFDGKGYTISNWKTILTGEKQGLFCLGSGATVTNINLNNFNVELGRYSGLFSMVSRSSDVEVSYIHVSDSIITGETTHNGVIIGEIFVGTNIYIKNNIVDNCIVFFNEFSGVIVGFFNGVTPTMYATDNTVKDTTFKVNAEGSFIVSFNNRIDSSVGVITDNTIIDSTLLSRDNCAGVVLGNSESASGNTINNVNLYSSQGTTYAIGPDGNAGNNVGSITNVADRYLYASSLTADVTGATAAYTLEGRQGSTTVEAAQGTAQSWAWTFGDGQTSTAAQDTTHTYAAPGTYQTNLALKNYLDSTGITVRTQDYNILPIPPTVSASANVLQLGQSTTLSAVGTLFSTIQWQYSTDSGATWQDISGATANNYVWTPEAGSYQVRAHVTAVGTGYTADSEVLTIGVYAPPTINAVTVSPIIGQYTQTITLSAEVTDNGPDATTYQWQQSPQGQNTWTNIPGATTSLWVGSITVSGPTDFRLLATGTGGTTTSSTLTYYIAAPGEIQSLSATPSVVALPGSTTLSATGSNIVYWEWQELISGSWQTIGTGATVRESLSAAGTYTYRVQATGADGAVVTSESIEVLAGFPPRVEITSPNDGAKFDSGARIDLSATLTGTDAEWQWDFGAENVETGGNGLQTWVEYGIDGQKTISIRAESVFGTDEDSITIISGRPSRPLASTPTTELDSDGIFVLTDSLTPGQNGQPDIWGFIQGLSKPFTDIIGAWFYLALFAVPYFIIWIRQKNIIIPSILGVMFGAWILVMLPASALPAAIGILTLAITGGLYGLYVKINNR